MADLEASVDLSIAGALTRVAQLEAALKRATSVSLGGAGGTGISKASTDMRALEQHTEAAFRQFSRLAQVGSTMTKFVTLPIVGAGAAAVALATQFEASMTNLITRAGVAPAAIGGIRKALLDLAPVVGAVPNELARGLELIEGDGIHGAAAMDVLRASAEGAAIGLGSVKDVAAAVTTILNAYPDTVISASAATNVLTAAVKEGKVEASEMARQLGRVAEPAALVGIKVDEVAGGIAALSRVTGNASQATTDFAGLLSFLIKPSVQAQKALEGVGLSSQQLLDTIKSQGLLAALDLLRTAFGDNALALGQLFRNRQGLIGFLGLTQDFERTTAIFGETAKGFRDSGKDIDGFSTVAQTASFKFKQAMAEIQKAGIAFGADIAPAVATAAKSVSGLIGSFSDLPKPVKLGIEAVAGIAAIGGPILVAIGQVGKLQTAIKNMVPESLQSGVVGVTKAVGTAVTSLTAFTSAFVATQGGATQAAVGLVGAAASIGVAFAVGGPLGGALAGVATIGGLVAGAFANSAKEAAKFKAEAHTLADTLLKDLTPALQASLGFKIDLREIGFNKELAEGKAKIAAEFTKQFTTADKIRLHDVGLTVQDFADRALASNGAVGAMSKLNEQFLHATFSAQGLESDLLITGVSIDQLTAAALKGKPAVTALLTHPRTGELNQQQYDIQIASIGRLQKATDSAIDTTNNATQATKISGAAVAEVNVTLKENELVARRASSQMAGYGKGMIKFAQDALGVNDVSVTFDEVFDSVTRAGGAQADFIAEFDGADIPVGIGILDKLGLTVDEVAVGYKDLEKAAKAAHDAVADALSSPIDQAQTQLGQIKARKQLIEDAADANKAPPAPTVTTKTASKTTVAALVAASGKKKLTAAQIDALILANTPVPEDSTVSVKNKVITTTKKPPGGGGGAGALNTNTVDPLLGLTDEQIKVRSDVMDRLTGAQKLFLDTVTELPEAFDQAHAAYTANIVDLENLAPKLGATKEQVDAFVFALGASPDQVKTTFQTLGLLTALAKTDDYKLLLNSIDPKVATELVAATKGEDRVKILVDYFNSLDPVERRKLAAEVQGAEAVAALKKSIDETKSKTVTLTVQANIDAALRGGANPGNFDGTFGANGMIVHAANGYIPRISHIAAGRRGGITWAEPETGWEAYISGKPSMRARNEQILAETARRFGMEVYKQPRRFDSGGTINLPPVTISSDPRMNALLERMSALLDQGGKGDIIVQVEAPDSKNPDVYGARIGHAFRAAAL